jgi:hypothetical protein
VIVVDENKIGNISFFEEEDNQIIKSDSSFYAESFYFKKIYDDQEFKRFVQNTERLIRGSREYNKYVELLRTNLHALNIDSILSNITTADAELEFHHYPFSLYDIVEIISAKNFLENKNFNTFRVSKEVLELHYKNLIGLVPLSKTNHELAHTGNLFLSSKQVFGDYKSFMEKYNKGISADLVERIKKMEELSEKDIASDIRGLF